MITSQNGISLIQHFEGLRLKGYLDPIGIPTIGYGHTGRDVKVGQIITGDEATRLLTIDLGHAEVTVANYVRVELEQHQFDALVSFTFNLGSGNLRRSTLLTLVNAKRWHDASDEFPKWAKAGGKELPGLVHRRYAERLMFLGEPWA
jgi:lysozyme